MCLKSVVYKIHRRAEHQERGKIFGVDSLPGEVPVLDDLKTKVPNFFSRSFMLVLEPGTSVKRNYRISHPGRLYIPKCLFGYRLTFRVTFCTNNPTPVLDTNVWCPKGYSQNTFHN